MAESPPNIDGLGLAELKSLLLQAFEKISQQDAQIAALREENARLKGLKGRPQIKPSGMEKATQGRAEEKRKGGRRRGGRRKGVSAGDVAPNAQSSPSTRPKSSSPRTSRPAPASKDMRTSSSRTSLCSRGRFSIGASAGSCRLARRWSPLSPPE